MDAEISGNVQKANDLTEQQRKERNVNTDNFEAIRNNIDTITQATCDFFIKLIQSAPLAIRVILLASLEGALKGDLVEMVYGVLIGATGGTLTGLQQSFVASATNAFNRMLNR